MISGVEGGGESCWHGLCDQNIVMYFGHRAVARPVTELILEEAGLHWDDVKLSMLRVSGETVDEIGI